MSSIKKNNKKGSTKAKLLLVVSNDLIRDIFKELFEKNDYYIVAVDTAKDGFKALNDEYFNIVICDFDLYDSTGVEFFESVKDIRQDRNNILMVTYGDEADISNVKKLNIRHILEKPFPFEELINIVKQLT